MLKINKINSHYGRIQALWDVSLHVAEDEIVAVIGANGAGKTTLLRSIMGLIEPASGMIRYAGRRIDGLDPYKISELGIAYVPEGGGPFRDMSVLENLEMGAYHSAAWKRPGGTRAQAGPHVKRRRAADVGDRPRLDVTANAVRFRRAIHWPVAASGG
jgi:ABC-type branched-subunit amino acid transport system ATPase component